MCEDHEQLIERYLRLILDSNYSRIENENSTNISFLRFGYRKKKIQSRVDLIVSYLTQDMQTLLFRLNYQGSGLIPVFAYNSNVTIPPEIHTGVYTVWGNTVTEDELRMNVLLGLFKWQRVGFLHIRNSSKTTASIYETLYQVLTKTLRDNHPDMCYYTETIDVANKMDFDRAAQNLYKERSTNVVVLFGAEKDKIGFINTVKSGLFMKHIIWVTQDFDMKHIKLKLPIKLITLNNRLRGRLISVRKSLFRDAKASNQAIVGNSVAETAYTIIETVKWHIQQLDIRWRPFQKTPLTFVDMRAFYFMFSRETWTVRSPVMKPNLIKNYPRLFKSVFLGESSCPRLVCPPGWRQVSGQQYLPHQTKWKFEYGWTCRPCKANQVKSVSGNGTCTTCPEQFIANTERTKCYDPFSRVYLKRNLTYKICVVLSIIGVIVSLCLKIVFLVNRNSPIGKSTDFGMTMCHLSTALVLQLSLLLLYSLGRTTRVSCLLGAAMYALLYSLFISITLVKSRKLTKAFMTKQRATHRDRQLVFAQQVFTIALLVTIPIAMLFIAEVKNPNGVTEETGSTTYEILVYCSEPFHKTIQLGYALALQVACLITAYKGRKLPSLFNESMAMVYASLTTTIALIVMFVVQAFQKDPLRRPLIDWMAVSFNLNTFLLFLYGKKVWVMLFRSVKNTRGYMQQKTFEFATRLVDARTEKSGVLIT